MNYVIGIDEVGRGALAGPVVVAAAMVPADRAWIRAAARARAKLAPLRDSKKLTALQREAWSAYLKGQERSGKGIGYALARVYPRGIERLNISGAANRAAERAFAQLAARYGLKPAQIKGIFLDGGLFLGDRAKQKRLAPGAKTVIKGDERIPAVAAASIIAKVARDRFMVRLAKRHPEYAFEVHKGYGTKLHREALAKAGPCAAHRLTFMGRKPIMNR